MRGDNILLEIALVIPEILRNIHAFLVLVQTLEDHELLVLGVCVVGNDVAILDLAVLEHGFATDFAAFPDDASGQHAAFTDNGVVEDDASSESGAAADLRVGANAGFLDDAFFFDSHVGSKKAVGLGDHTALSDAFGVSDLLVVCERRRGRSANLFDRF